VTKHTELARASKYCVTMRITLRDGTILEIRTIRPSDKEGLRVGLARLSERSRYSRFLTPKSSFSASELRYLTEVDGVDHYALVATPVGDPEQILAVGRWVRWRERPDHAETAVVVADRLQRLGLGGELGRRLAAAAARRDVKRFTATILGTNVAASRLLESMHVHLERQTGAGLTEVAWDLAA
jgi:GNAT superfamily N-acetyltransferase